MKTNELLAIGIRLLGIYFLIQFVQFIGAAYFSYTQVVLSMPDINTHIISVGYIITAVMILIFSLAFIKFPATVANKLLPNTSNDSPLLSGSAKELQLAGFSLLGIYILSWSIPDLIHNSALLIVIPNYDESYSMVNRPYDLINLGVTLVEITIGLYLTLQAQGLVKLINKVRYAGS